MRSVTVIRGADCAHGRDAVAAIAALASRLNVSVSIEQVIVSTDAEARAARCIGSPTVLINGRDVEPSARGLDSFGVT